MVASAKSQDFALLLASFAQLKGMHNVDWLPHSTHIRPKVSTVLNSLLLVRTEVNRSLGLPKLTKHRHLPVTLAR